MKVVVLMERNVTDSVIIEVESYEELKELILDPKLLHETIDNQNECWEEVVGECIDTRFEDDSNNEFVIKDGQLVKRIYKEGFLFDEVRADD